jgi:hypothetical protein
MMHHEYGYPTTKQDDAVMKLLDPKLGVGALKVNDFPTGKFHSLAPLLGIGKIDFSDLIGWQVLALQYQIKCDEVASDDHQHYDPNRFHQAR